MQVATTARQTAEDAIQTTEGTAGSQLAVTYQAAIDTAKQTYQTAHAAIEVTYEGAIQQAEATMNTRIGSAQAVYDAAVATAQANLDQATQTNNATYQLALLAADSIYQQALAPQQLAVSAAQVTVLANPDDPDAQAALSLALQNFTDAQTQAVVARDAAMGAASRRKKRPMRWRIRRLKQ